MPYKDPEAERRYHREYKRANRWRYRKRDKAYDAAVHANRRARQFGVIGSITVEDAEAVLNVGVCQYCGTTVGLMTIDHIVSMARGGENVPANLTTACLSCNISKWHGDRPGRWGRDHDQCVACGTTERRHIAKGLCNPCYLRQRKGLPTTGR